MVDYKKIRAKQRDEYGSGSQACSDQRLPGEKISVDTLLPDFGHYCFEHKPDAAVYALIQNPLVSWSETETNIAFEAHGYLATLIVDGLTKQEAKAMAAEGFAAEIKPSPSEKYQSGDKREWIIPFRIVSFF